MTRANLYILYEYISIYKKMHKYKDFSGTFY